MRNKKRILALVCSSALLATPLLANERRAPRCQAIRVAAVEASTENGRSFRRRGASFSVRDVTALEFQVFLSSELAGSHRVELKLYTPQGDLYQTLTTVHQSSSEEAVGGSRRRRRRRYQDLRLLFPIADTTVVRSSIYGSWRAEAHLDGQPKACSRPLRFEMSR